MNETSWIGADTCSGRVFGWRRIAGCASNGGTDSYAYDCTIGLRPENALVERDGTDRNSRRER
jgi:hypothetical protein